jgi:hypothetical protein
MSLNYLDTDVFSVSISSVICLPSICEYQWSQLARIRTPPIVTSDSLYVRFIDDISIDEKDFGKFQKDKVLEVNKWAGEIKKVGKENVRGKNKEVRLAMIAANNHYAGFGPGTANLFRKMVGSIRIILGRFNIQKHLQLLQQQQKEKQDQQVINSRMVSEKKIKNRQSSLSEFID